MLILRTERFKKDYHRLPAEIQTRAGRNLEIFLRNHRHPSLGVKRMEGAPDIREMRVSGNYRITFEFVEEGVLLRRIGTHNIFRRP